ncbi:MAG: DUF2490 domain-containing protein [Bacteroides sp.]|nr:DUF2490 domain-containing protein [Bacteroides sp.]
MNKKNLIGCLLLLGMPLFAYGQSDDFGIWTSAGARKRLFPGLVAELEGEFRLRDNLKETDRWGVAADLSYRIIPYLKVGASYNLIRFHHEKRGWETRHRYSLYGVGSYDWNRFTLSLRERYQHTYKVGVSSTAKRANPKDVLRSRLKLEYDIRKSPFSPYASVELFHTLNDPQGNGLEKIRYTAGTGYKLNKRNRFDFYYHYQDQADDDETNGHILGIGYQYRF